MTSITSHLSELDLMLRDLSNHIEESTVDYSSDYSEGLPKRPPPPSSHSSARRSDDYMDTRKVTLSIPGRPAPPPKLEHALLKDRRHDLVKAKNRTDDSLKVRLDETDYYDYGTMTSSIREDSVDAGEAPRGDKSMIIHTDYGDLKSKYNYLGFGLWENTEPDEPPPPPRKLSPPPPPPKAEPVWYNCTVSVETHKTTKELDDLKRGMGDYAKFEPRFPEIASETGDAISVKDLHEPFEKEDMSEMFQRAFLEKMSGDDDGKNRKLHKCFVCSEYIKGRIITAMAKKFHPECFVCTYCKNQFKERKYKTDDIENKPYCYDCFEKLLGHFGNVRSLI